MKLKFTDEYRMFQHKIMLRFIGTALTAVGVTVLIYFLVWHRRAGDWIVSLMQRFGMDQHEAFWFYHGAFRQNKSMFWGVAIVLIFVVLLRFLFVWLVRYLNDINQGIDQLLAEKNDSIHLFPEMEPMEYKLNTVKQTLWQRKQDTLLAEQRKNELVMYLAHDIRTPLTSVIGYLNLLQEAPEMPTEQKANYVHIALDKAYRLEKMVNEFFEITRYHFQQINLSKTPIDLYYMLVQIIDEHTPALAAHGNHVQLDASENLAVCGDAEKLARVFNNLLKNAAAYSYPHTDIRIAAKEMDGVVEITFQNKGKTISREQLRLLFQKFSRLDDARTSDTGGAGLGLAIAKEIVILHGGTIQADSTDETVSFIVRLPAGLS